MSKLFEELDYCPTPIGAVSLRRRFDFQLNKDVFEIKLGEEFLMSSFFTESEIALSRLALEKLLRSNLNVLVGGLGLGCTAKEVLTHEKVASLLVVELLQPVIEWHKNGLLPLGEYLTSDPRCEFQLGDFFALAQSEFGFDSKNKHRKFDAILLDIDHSPENFLDNSSAPFYQPEGLVHLKNHMRSDAIFGLWSNDAPSSDFTARLEKVFGFAVADPITFNNPLQDRLATQTVYLASSVSLIDRQ